ncbi:MAG TPA: Asp-tRNA(Asn)/Glu-tRNA(Gln) amidotransferase GatCAB subunit B, partial [Blastocatellia bacterium]|nr:Asp-tRNA(Asn)/Glu-tRNA(Gln) amidotransferase GatCAB subunit B [Blastocatellia bacterium]
YRYFPEPDLPPLVVDEAFIERLRAAMPELSEARRQRFISDYGLSFDNASQLTEARSLAEYFEETARACGNAKSAANWILNELLRELKNAGAEVAASPVSAASLGGMIRLIDSGSISGKMAKDVLIEMYRSGKPADEVVREMGGSQLSDEAEIRALAEKAVADNPRQAEQYRAGKTALFGFFVGQVMKLSGGRANPQVVNEVLKRALES